MQRRDFLALTAAAIANPSTRGAAEQGPPQTAGCTSGASGRLAGLSLLELRQHLHAELVDSYLPFWDRYGIDHKYGGLMCAIDHDGTRINDNKFHWFQGRGAWVYSFLYNYFGKNPTHLEIAQQAKDFMMAHFPQPDGTWNDSTPSCRSGGTGRLLLPATTQGAVNLHQREHLIQPHL